MLVFVVDSFWLAFLLVTESSTPADLRATSLIITGGGGGGVERIYTSLVKAFFNVGTIFLFFCPTIVGVGSPA
jgi:hypothetical protein